MPTDCGIVRLLENDAKDHARAKHDRYVRDIEHSRSHWSHSDVQEVDNAASSNPVNPVRSAARDEQRQTQRGPSVPPASNREDHEHAEEEPCTSREQPGSHDRWQAGAKAQEPAWVLDVHEANRIRQIGSRGLSGEHGRCGMLCYAVATDRRKHRHHQGKSPGCLTDHSAILLDQPVHSFSSGVAALMQTILLPR